MASVSAEALIYPELGDPEFSKKLGHLQEYRVFTSPPLPVFENESEFENKVQLTCSTFEKSVYQHFIQHYLSRRSPYRSILLYHGLGTGKTCSAITVSESLLLDHTQNDPPAILVISSSALKKNFEEELFSTSKFIDTDSLKDQCNSDLYRKLTYGTNDKELIIKRIQSLISSGTTNANKQPRYEFITYDGLIKYNEEHKDGIENKVIIIDEAHNLRQNEKEKASAEALEKLLENGNNNRLVLLSATPMYNEPNEIFWLLSLLLKNDKRDDIQLQKYKLFKKKESIKIKESFDILKKLAGEYISYVRGTNPFTFPVRLSPRMNNIPILNDAWCKNIVDGIVPTEIGSKQKVTGFAKDVDINKDIKTNFQVQIQLTNITFPGGKSSEKGLQTVFDIDDKDGFKVKYKSKYNGLLKPTPENLGAIAAKMQRICEFIESSEGIVVVYSQFVTNGVIPLAIALEHMGFSRFGTSGNILNRPDVLPNKKFPGIPFPKYAILCGDTNIMNGTKINTILSTLNSSENIHGEKIKVILMTPVAAEGLSIKNVREVHILDPWYHINRIEQIIGRSIRTCSHIKLPLEERNVTVYLHACIHSTDNKDTPDIHAYKIAALKLFQTKEVEKVIRDTALDCSFMQNVNYYPENLFPFSIVLRTSQKNVIPLYKFGDPIDSKPQCEVDIESDKKPDSRSMRPEIFENLIKTYVRKLEKYILHAIKSRIYYYKLDELINVLNTNSESKDIAMQTISKIIYPNILIPKYKLLFHRDGIVAIPDINEVVGKRLKIPTAIEDTQVSECNVENIIKNIYSWPGVPTNELVGIYRIYTVIDSQCWPFVAKYIIENNNPINEKLGSYLFKTGALISKEELPKLAANDKQKYVGFANIFNTSGLEFSVYDNNLKDYRDINDQEIRLLKSKRFELKKPDNEKLQGIFEPSRFRKSKLQIYTNDFKIFGVRSAAAGKIAAATGASCTPKKLFELEEIMEKIGLKRNTGEIKDHVCIRILIELLHRGLLFTYPALKPSNNIYNEK